MISNTHACVLGSEWGTVISRQRIVVVYDPRYESMGVFYNDSGKDVGHVDFWGRSDQGKLERVETLNARAYWCVWVNFFRNQTSIAVAQMRPLTGQQASRPPSLQRRAKPHHIGRSYDLR
ncbi:MAG: hypothetical protein QF515_00655 [Pseudomonadales bacterium]|jgi:hypothetical protein|nr:hypothetical protein [Pseudomonadales bacterium]MDP6825619.1 hypothetical protein [Pseudomonadales bacterium]|tara:strand:- start:4673 stop:5032 length:360 start_codon:yes stop_codon:yes gene_type:complete